MNHFKELRNYKRSTVIICKALVSIDSIIWDKVDLKDISAGGLLFTSTNRYAVNEPLRFNLYLYNVLSEFCMMIEGYVIRDDQNNALRVYGFRFNNIDNHTRVQLDELINSRVTVKKYN